MVLRRKPVPVGTPAIRASAWASHPNAALRLEIARDVRRGWKVRELGERSAIMVRPRRFSIPAYILLTPLYLIYAIFQRDEAIKILADAAGTVTWRTPIDVPTGGLRDLDTSETDAQTLAQGAPGRD